MRGSADTTGMPDVRSRRVFFRSETVCRNQQLETKLESTPNFSHSEMRAVRGPSCMTFGRSLSLHFLSTSIVAAFRTCNPDSGNGVSFATSWRAREIIALGAHYSHSAFLNFGLDSSSEGERCMKDTDHPVRHPLRHPRVFGRAQSR
jgi:hypothetical protein